MVSAVVTTSLVASGMVEGRLTTGGTYTPPLKVYTYSSLSGLQF